MLRIDADRNGFRLSLAGRTLIDHAPDRPALFVGRGRADIAMRRGNFRFDERLDERVALRGVRTDADAMLLAAEPGGAPLLRVWIDGEDLRSEALAPGLNRFWLRLSADAAERVWGAGAQYSHLNLRGRRFPLWVSEPGVGRDKASALTFEADRTAGAGGDYWTTGYAQPTFLSDRCYALHVETHAYAAFDFRDPTFHEVEVWEVPAAVAFVAADSLSALVGRLSECFGRAAPIPAWSYGGAIVGLKDGANSLARHERIIDAGAAVTGLWCEDWVGVRETSFGKRLFWDWRHNEVRYPGLHQRIAELNDSGVRFLGYVNPYLAVDGALYGEALHAGFLVRRADGSAYEIDFGEFAAAHVDLTNPEAMDWFAERIIGREMLDFGLSGWMADFGEYLPTDAVLHDHTPASQAHNRWPVLWAEVNARAIAARGATADATFFMRSGWTGVQRWCPLLWAGDQCVDFSRHDGIGTTIRAALSAGLLGNAHHHSDLGGYTSLFGLVRTPELLMRWGELSAFTPVMRSHEGNRPADNLQIDSTPEILSHFARMTRVHAALSPYTAALVADAQATGLPAMRPLFLHHADDPASFESETQYLYGRDLLVAPIVEAGVSTARAYLPGGTDWIDLWGGDLFPGGAEAAVTAPFGRPPVFARADSPWLDTFARAASA